jgi:hypothetical protein
VLHDDFGFESFLGVSGTEVKVLGGVEEFTKVKVLGVFEYILRVVMKLLRILLCKCFSHLLYIISIMTKLKIIDIFIISY